MQYEVFHNQYRCNYNHPKNPKLNSLPSIPALFLIKLLLRLFLAISTYYCVYALAFQVAYISKASRQENLCMLIFRCVRVAL